MKVRMLRTHRSYRAGEIYDLHPEEAEMWIHNGLALLVEVPDSVPDERPKKKVKGDDAGSRNE